MMRKSPVELETPLLFAPNVTPGTFMKTEEAEPLDLPQNDSMLFPCPEESTPVRRHGHSKRKAEDHIPRPPNAFILFRSSFIRSQHVSAEVETDHSTLSKIIGLTWQNLPEKERQVWHEKARVAKEEHRRKFPGYTFRPNAKGKSKPGKRTVREVFPKDLKRCAKIAELLVKGKKGGTLDVAMQEFDRHHKMEVVTKFEEPITAQQFARSSSAPVDEERVRKGQHHHHITLSSRLRERPLHQLSATTCASGYYAPPSPLDEQLLGPILPGFQQPGTEPSSPDHHQLLVNPSFTHFNTWPACSSPCSSDAPTTPIQSVPIDPPLSFQHTDYYDPTPFPSFDIPQQKSFPDLPSQQYYENTDLMLFPGHPHTHQVQPPSFDFDFSAFLSTVSHDTL
ncbi:hypothetical protein F5887DRAFT_1068407 [Amanita rubescens]|nr:hypothetical protein F5887DRAFT_1068407 [Amanita rubescens]